MTETIRREGANIYRDHIVHDSKRERRLPIYFDQIKNIETKLNTGVYYRCGKTFSLLPRKAERLKREYGRLVRIASEALTSIHSSRIG